MVSAQISPKFEANMKNSVHTYMSYRNIILTYSAEIPEIITVANKCINK